MSQIMFLSQMDVPASMQCDLDFKLECIKAGTCICDRNIICDQIKILIKHLKVNIQNIIFI
jgi:hypothetical protein